jgi:hypothetical protein
MTTRSVRDARERVCAVVHQQVYERALPERRGGRAQTRQFTDGLKEILLLSRAPGCFKSAHRVLLPAARKIAAIIRIAVRLLSRRLPACRRRTGREPATLEHQAYYALQLTL